MRILKIISDKYIIFWNRITAFIIDFCFITLINLLIAYFVGFIPLFSILIITAYYAVSESSKIQATLGKKIIGLKIININGQKQTFEKSLIRNLLKISLPLAFLENVKIDSSFIIICFFITLFIINSLFVVFTKQNQSFLDIISNSLIISSSENKIALSNFGKFTIITPIFLVITAVFIMSTIILPSQQSQNSTIKHNMYLMKSMLETYSIDWDGKYPENTTTLIQEAENKKYKKEIKNPFKNQNFLTINDEPKNNKSYFSSKVDAGVIAYYVHKNRLKYALYASGVNNNQILTSENKIYSLTNN
ncbi:MAG: RDD family protein [Candidatus Sericytochromatia bacterium]|nr:RDD family protein [Candidatus Sericytochromatia bacterium]